MADPPHYTPRDLPNTTRGLAFSIDLPNTTSSTGQPVVSEKQTEIESARSISNLELALLGDNFTVDNILYRHLINSAMQAIYDTLCAAFMQTAYGVLVQDLCKSNGWIDHNGTLARHKFWRGLPEIFEFKQQQYEALARKRSMKGVIKGSLRFYDKYNAVVRPEYKISSSDHLDDIENYEKTCIIALEAIRQAEKTISEMETKLANLRVRFSASVWYDRAQQVKLKQNDDETACKGVQQLITICKNQKCMCMAKLEAEKKLSEELKYLVWDEQVMKLLQSKDVEIFTNLGNHAAHPDNYHSRALAAVDHLSLRLDVDEASRTVIWKIGYILVKSKEKPDTLREHEFNPDTIEDNRYYA
ncbi:hypothetical protein ACEPAI_2838 [Sanghuangporus weigelae]